MTAVSPTGPPGAVTGVAADETAPPAGLPDTPWRRLSARMLLVHPVMELVRALPAVVALLIVGSQREGGWWAYIGVAVPVVIGLIRWVSTRYRITPTQIQVRRGLLGRSVRTVPRDRVRSVDLTSHLMHRLLGLTKASVGTGQVDRQRESGLVLDGLSKQDAASLREELLHTRNRGQAALQQLRATEVQRAVTLLARLRPAWIRYGPFTLSGLLTIFVVAGFSWRTINEAHLNPDQFGPLRAVTGHLSSLSLAWAAVEVAVVGLLLVAISSTLAYVLAFWKFELTRTHNGTLHISRGLVTTRSTTIEERRLRGVEISETLLLRSVRAARCSAITTGLRFGRGAERGTAFLLPPAPVTEARRVAGLVLYAGEPVSAPLTRHSPAARRRRYTRALIGAAILIGLAGLLSFTVSQPGWVVAAAIALPVGALLVARDRFRNLGHTIVDNRVVFGVGSLIRRRYMVNHDGVIGWNMRQSFFQRRSGLVTLTATTAAGRQHYTLPDVDAPVAVGIADQVLPGLLTPFLVREYGPVATGTPSAAAPDGSVARVHGAGLAGDQGDQGSAG